jgi:hypothetical protein
VPAQASTSNSYHFETEATWKPEVSLNPRIPEVPSFPRPSLEAPSFQASTNFGQPSPTSLAIDGDIILDIYRDQFAPQFPFVVIPQNITSNELASQKPWLHRAISIVGYKADREKQLEMTSKLLSDVALVMLLRAEKSLDLCQCLIIMNVWLVCNNFVEDYVLTLLRSYFFSPTSPSMSSAALNSLLVAAIYVRIFGIL